MARLRATIAERDEIAKHNDFWSAPGASQKDGVNDRRSLWNVAMGAYRAVFEYLAEFQEEAFHNFIQMYHERVLTQFFMNLRTARST